MVIERFDYKVEGEARSIVLRYLKFAKCYLLIQQLNCSDLWSEAFDSRKQAILAFREQVALERATLSN